MAKNVRKLRKIGRSSKSLSKGGGKTFLLRYVIVSLGVLVIAILWALSVKQADRPYVLGTSVFLAKDGGEIERDHDEDEDEAEDEKEVERLEDSEQHGSSSGGNSGSGSLRDNSGFVNSDLQRKMLENVVVDCVGPDGKHFRTDIKTCKKLNEDWGRGSFKFTELRKTDARPSDVVKRKVEVSPESLKLREKVENSSGAGEKREIRLEIEKGKVVVKDKSESVMYKSGERQSLDEINKGLGEDGIKLRKTIRENFAIKSGSVEAETHFPLRIDTESNQLTVVTPNGEKKVAVLPDQAVENVLKKGLINSIETGVEGGASGEAEIAQKSTLTEINNELVFQIKGFSNKKFMGILPTSFAKTVYVSANNGEVVKTNETFLNRVLELLSF